MSFELSMCASCSAVKILQDEVQCCIKYVKGTQNSCPFRKYSDVPHVCSEYHSMYLFHFVRAPIKCYSDVLDMQCSCYSYTKSVNMHNG